MSKILVTGASGFIGKHLVPQLRAASHTVIEANSVSGDVADAATWASFDIPEVVVHLAGKSFVPASWTDPASFVKCNVQGTVNALDFCRKNNARLVYISSYLYGNPEKLPIPETAPMIANNPYALSKKLAEDACKFYAGSFGVPITILRPFNVYGPQQDQNFLIPSIIRYINAGQLIEVKDLEPKRDYVYISDLVEAIMKSVELTRGFSIFNIGSGKSYSVKELIQVIQKVYGTDLNAFLHCIV